MKCNSLLQSPEASNLPSENTAYQQISSQGKKAFQCLNPGCEKIFKYKSDAQRHLLVHTKEKSITCPYPSCDKAFKRPEALRSHIQVIHLENTTFSCPHPGCPLKFPKKSTLQLHLLKHIVIQKRALNASEDEEASVPWKRLVRWEKEWWHKVKALFAQNSEGNQPFNLQNFGQDLDFLSAFGGATPRPEDTISQFFKKNDSFSCFSRDFSDTFSVMSFEDGDNGSLSPKTQDLIRSFLNQTAQENHELAKNLDIT